MCITILQYYLSLGNCLAALPLRTCSEDYCGLLYKPRCGLKGRIGRERTSQFSSRSPSGGTSLANAHRVALGSMQCLLPGIVLAFCDRSGALSACNIWNHLSETEAQPIPPAARGTTRFARSARESAALSDERLTSVPRPGARTSTGCSCCV